MKEIFLIGRLGNKTNDIKYFKNLLPLDVDKIIEPFGGSFAVSRLVYNDSKYYKHINDTDPNLFFMYNNYNKYVDFYKRLQEKAKSYDLKTETKKFVNDLDELDEDKDAIKFFKESCFIKGYIVKICKTIPVKKEFENYNFTNQDYKEILKQYQHDEKALIFLDPPYLFSNNSNYSSQSKEDGGDTDMTDIILYLKDFINDTKTKCRVMIIINKLKILEWIFKGNITGEYDRIYQIGKRKDKHLIITNY